MSDNVNPSEPEGAGHEPEGAAPSQDEASRGTPERSPRVLFSPALVFLAVLLIVIAAIVVRYGLITRDRERQKETWSMLRSIGTAVESYQVDNGYVPTTAGPALSVEAIRPVLEPTFIKVLPVSDAWGGTIYWQHESPATSSYTLWSAGKDGGRDGAPIPFSCGATTDVNCDLYFSPRGAFAIPYECGTQE